MRSSESIFPLRPLQRALFSKQNGLRLAGLAWAVVILAGCSKAPEADPRTVPPMVLTTRAAPAADAVRRFSGVVAARVQSNLGFRVNGKVIERLVDVGQPVKRGQPLMKLDTVDLELAITMRRAELNAARARSVQAIAEEARQAGLIRTGATSQQLFDNSKAAADTAAAQVELAEAALRTAENSGGYATLYADADGTVVETLAEPGQVVAAGETVVRLAHAGVREASVYLPETVRPGTGSVAVARIYGGNSTITAHLRQLSEAADPVTRTFEARYTLEGDSIPLGATVSIELDGHAEEVSVPIGALTDRGSGPGVWVLAPGGTAVSFRPVRVEKMGAEDALLRGGVKAGETIVALGAHLLSDGEAVRVAADKEVATNE